MDAIQNAHDAMAGDERRQSRRLICGLESTDAATRQAALAELDTLDPDRARRLLSVSLSWGATLKSVARSRLVLLTIGGAVILALLAVPPARSADPDLRMTTSILLPCGLFTLYLCVYGFGHVRRVARVIESLAETNNPGALGLLIRLMSIEPQSAALRSPLPSTERLAPALVRVLSRIRPEQRGLLDSEEHRLLCHLMIGPHRELAHAALDAVVRLGEPVGEAYLRLLLRDSEPGRSRITIYPGLRRRAADGLRKIEERRQRAAVGTTLLRPCGPPEPEVETLLRPALSCTTEVEKLLRPA